MTPHCERASVLKVYYRSLATSYLSTRHANNLRHFLNKLFHTSAALNQPQ